LAFKLLYSGNQTSQIKTMKKTLLAVLAIGALSSALFSQQAQATPINGIINFAGAVHLNGPFGTATAVTAWLNAHVEAGSTGDFAGIPVNTPATFTAPWQFSPSTPVPALWSVAGFTFDLLTSTVLVHNGTTLSIEGTGIVSGNGFDPTAMTWAFTSQNKGGSTFSFSATGATVPDGGSAVALLGLALTGLEVVRRKLRVG
jgi:hypothetical protein